MSKLNERSAKRPVERKQRGKKANAPKNSGQELSNNDKTQEQTETPQTDVSAATEAPKNAEGNQTHKKQQKRQNVQRRNKPHKISLIINLKAHLNPYLNLKRLRENADANPTLPKNSSLNFRLSPVDC